MEQETRASSSCSCGREGNQVVSFFYFILAEKFVSIYNSIYLHIKPIFDRDIKQLEYLPPLFASYFK